MQEFLNLFEGKNMFNITNLRRIGSANGFYREIVNNLRTATNVYIITLYLGSMKKSKVIFNEIRNRKRNKKSTKIIVDYNRCNQNKDVLKLLKTYQIEDVVYFANKKRYGCLPNLLKELLFVLHDKVYIFDDLIILSGANLDENYFTSRLDRYFCIHDIALTNFILKNVFCHFYVSSFTDHGNNDMQGMNSTLNLSLVADNRMSVKSNTFAIENTFVLPYCENEELFFIEKMYDYGFDEYYISTAYLNFPNDYVKNIEKHKTTVISPDASCNTFYGSSLFDRLICKIYDHYIVHTKNTISNAEVRIFHKERTSFHYKGIWAFNDNFAITIIGSSNFNERSYRRDKELGFMVVTSDRHLMRQFKDEVEYLKRYSKKSDDGGTSNIFVKTIACLMKSFL